MFSEMIHMYISEHKNVTVPIEEMKWKFLPGKKARLVELNVGNSVNTGMPLAVLRQSRKGSFVASAVNVGALYTEHSGQTEEDSPLPQDISRWMDTGFRLGQNLLQTESSASSTMLKSYCCFSAQRNQLKEPVEQSQNYEN